MDAQRLVIQAAEARARALANRDPQALEDPLHDDFRWTSHTGETLGRDDYIARNTMGSLKWRSQHLGAADVVVVGEAAVLYAEAIDVVGTAAGDEDLPNADDSGLGAPEQPLAVPCRACRTTPDLTSATKPLPGRPPAYASARATARICRSKHGGIDYWDRCRRRELPCAG